MASYYIDLEINELQMNIMRVVSIWAREQKTAISQRTIIEIMEPDGIKSFAVVNALNGLMKKGYLRRGVAVSTKTTYVQLRTVI